MRLQKVEFTALCEKIRAIVQAGDYLQAEKEAAVAMCEHPDAPEPHNLMGIIMEKQNNHVGAMKHFRAACALDPSYRPARINLDQYCNFSSGWRNDIFDESDLS